MALIDARVEPDTRRLQRIDPAWLVVTGAMVVAVLARLPFLTSAATSDEGGFLIVGRQWTRAGDSLYTGDWVDRPPLLIAIFRLAADHGGLLGLRLIGCLAVAGLIGGAAWTARIVAGPRAGAWAAAAVAALSFSPMLDGMEVNGELLAAPFVAVAFGCVLTSLQSRRVGAALAWAALAGALGASAVLIKQNFVDVYVFAVVAVIAALLQRRIGWRRALVIVAGGLAGATVLVAAVAALTLSRGTSLSGVLYAMYPFRLRAATVLATYDSVKVGPHLRKLAAAGVASGMVAVIGLAVIDTVLRRPRSVAAFALTAVLAFDLVSVLGGGSYWLHYLVQLVPAVGVWAGVLAGRRAPGARPLVVFMAVLALVAITVDYQSPGSEAQNIGTAIGASAQPSDTIVVTYGHADLILASGLRSPYRYLWSLPVKTLDPRLRDLDALLAGPDRPTWFVKWDLVHSWGIHAQPTVELVQQHYRVAGRLCGRTVYLRDDVRRAPLPRITDCEGPSSVRG